MSSPSTIPADSTGVRALYRHALHAVFALLGLPELVAVMATSTAWRAAASDVPPIHASFACATVSRLRQMLGSKLARHIRQLSLPDSLVVSKDVALVFQSLPHLTRCSASIHLDSSKFVPLVLPPQLRELVLAFPVTVDYQMSERDVKQLHAFFNALTQASELASLRLTLPYKSPLLDLAPLQNLRLQKRVVEYHVHDSYRRFIMDGPPEPLPPFPCAALADCTPEQPACRAHRCVLHIKLSTGPSFQIPWPAWNCWRWIKLRVEEACGIPVNQQRLIFAGCAVRVDFVRHSGLQNGSTIHVVQTAPPNPTEWNDHEM